MEERITLCGDNCIECASPASFSKACGNEGTLYILKNKRFLRLMTLSKIEASRFA